MRSFRILSALLALASSIHADAGVDPNEAPDDVIELTSENFATVVTPAPLILVEFSTSLGLVSPHPPPIRSIMIEPQNHLL
jgi:hypothetical protein